jgi:twitching motility protein PilT
LIGDKREDELPDLLKSCHNEGMLDFNECLYQLLETEFISMTVALSASPNPDELRMRLKGIRTGGSGLIG